MGWLAAALAATIGALAGCNATRAPKLLTEGGPAPIPADYRQKIGAWAARFYAEPGALRWIALADPVPIRVTGGAELWLVCVELEARARGGAPMGPRRVAIGFSGPTLSAPLERSGFDLRDEDCDRQPLAWRAWSGPGRPR